MDADLGELEASFSAALRMEQRAYADDLDEERERASTFHARLLALRRGPVVRLETVDAREMRGRVIAVGADWIRFVESEIPAALGRGRVREIRVDAVVAIEVLQ
ncbi:MAG: hypothetical protein IT198_12320 [Acidimicrobiia bacterium]|nr:hypothetical protein [Acidimicrobiia bacterium]